jgi:fido (protein-threonine AMPylation protein)
MGDIYDLAEDIRTLDVSSSETRFCTTQRIVSEAEKLFGQLESKGGLKVFP